jgi:hypothetical protein
MPAIIAKGAIRSVSSQSISLDMAKSSTGTSALVANQISAGANQCRKELLATSNWFHIQIWT